MAKQIVQQSLSAQNPLTSGGDTELPGIFLSKPNDPLFLAGCLGELRTKGLASKIDGEETETIHNEAIAAFLNDGKFNAELGAIQNILNFTSWLDETQWKYEFPVLFVVQEFTVSVTVPASSGQITFAMSAIPLDEDHTRVLAAMHKELSSNISAYFKQFSNKSITPNDTQKRQIEPSKVKDKTTTVDFVSLRVQEHNGEMKAYLMPQEGQWKQFGVRLFANMARKYGIDIPEEEDDYEFSGTMELTVKDGRPNIQSITL